MLREDARPVRFVLGDERGHLVDFHPVQFDDTCTGIQQGFEGLFFYPAHAAVSAGVHAGGTVAIVGDGAVGLCGVLAARRLGAQRIILLGHQAQRLSLGRRFGATDLVTSRGEQAEREVIELTAGGAEAVMECVGTKESMETAVAIARPGGSIGYVGMPHGSEQLNLGRLFRSNIALRGGVAPVRAYLPELLGSGAGRTARSFCCARSQRRSRWRSIGLRGDGSAHSPEGCGPALEGEEKEHV